MSNLIDKQRAKPTISPREMLLKYLRYLPWVFISVAIMLMAAFLKLRYSTYVYGVSGKLLVTTQSPYGNSSEKFDDIFMMQRGDKINDEIEIIKSRSMASRVIRSLGLQTQVYNRGKIRSSIIYPGDVPFNFEILHLADSSSGFGVLIKTLNNNQYTINEKPRKYFYNEIVELPGGKFRITANGKDWRVFASDEFQIVRQPLLGLSASISGTLNINRVNDYSNVLNLSYQTENTRLGIDIVNQYMREYQHSSLEDKKEIAARTLEFINEQLDTVKQELGGVEKNLQNYREKNRVFNAEQQSNLFFQQLEESGRDIPQQQVRIRITDYLSNKLSDQKNKYSMIPSMMGIEEPALLQQITEFNRLQLERETALQSTPASNPRILNMETAIEKLRVDMLETLKNVKQTQVLAYNELTNKNKEADQLISSIPSKEKQMREVMRQQNILQELYSYLLQKRLETSIASASTISNIKVVEPALASSTPIRPNKKILYLVAVLLGISIPTAIIFLLEYMNDKVKSKFEIEQIVSAPILGEVGHAEEASPLVVTRNNRRFLAEQFRIIRSNLQYIMPKVQKPVLLVTSSFSGEGKSFISTNLGSVLALSGKRTVILEFDIRKPKILKGLGLNERKGITNFIVGNINLKDVIHPVPEVENLYVIPCGPVPPNPSEMLLNEKIDELFAEVRSRFDAVIVDTAPVGLVSDALTLCKHADATVYIVRHNYTLKKQLHMINEIYEQNKLPSLSLIINDINVRGGYGGYYGYGGYGYGYGYGYGASSNGNSGYFDSEDKKKSGWWSRIVGR